MDQHAELGPWIAAWKGPLIGLIASLGVPWGDAAELAQDAFAEAWLARGRYRGDDGDLAAAGAWLRGIAINLVNNRRRSRRSLADVGELDPALPEADEDERLSALRAGISALPAKERAVICMHYLDETDVRHVAALLGVSEKTVEGRLYRGRKLLRERMTSILTALEQAR